jgi:hypothetical protein
MAITVPVSGTTHSIDSGQPLTLFDHLAEGFPDFLFGVSTNGQWNAGGTSS